MNGILKNQAELQKTLQKKFGFETKPVEFPLYTKIQENKEAVSSEINLKVITNKFGLLSKEEIENLP